MKPVHYILHVSISLYSWHPHTRSTAAGNVLLRLLVMFVEIFEKQNEIKQIISGWFVHFDVYDLITLITGKC